jgi:hypothetical protein
MEKTWKPTVAGILCIVAGALCVIPTIVVGWIYTPIRAALVIAPIVPIVGGIFALRRRIWGLALAGSIFTFINTLIIGMFFTIFLSVASLLNLFGSVDNPGVAPASLDPLSNALIVGLAICPIFGILAIVFIVKGRREFR